MASKKFYMVHWHKARRAGLHWDLRLEYDGVLKSWAIPKGMPVHGGRHLAIKVTDHSLSYGKWEGTIKSGYGAGEVKIDTTGQYETLEKTKKSWKFKILSGKYKGTWRLTHWKEDKWLISKSTSQSDSHSAEDNTQIAAESNTTQMSHKCRGCGISIHEGEIYSPDPPEDPDALILCRDCYMGHFAAEDEEEIPQDVQDWLRDHHMVAVADEEIEDNLDNAMNMYDNLFEEQNLQEQQQIIDEQSAKIDAEPVLVDWRRKKDRGFPNPNLLLKRWRKPSYQWPGQGVLEFRNYTFAKSGKTYEDIEFRLSKFDEWGKHIGFESHYAPIRVRRSLYSSKCSRFDCNKPLRKGDVMTWQGQGTQKHLSCWPVSVQKIVQEVLDARPTPLMNAEENVIMEMEGCPAEIREGYPEICPRCGEKSVYIYLRDFDDSIFSQPKNKQCYSQWLGLGGCGWWGEVNTTHAAEGSDTITEKQFRDYARNNPAVANAVDTDDTKFLTKGVLLGAIGGILVGTLSTVIGNIWSEFWLDIHRTWPTTRHSAEDTGEES